jgi:nucleoside-diphosphate-sugar epimerase
MKLLVLGAAGFLGEAFAAEADRRGWTTTRVDRRGYATDLRDWLADDATSYDLVVHAAAVVTDRLRIDRRRLAVTENADLDACVVRWAAQAKPRRLVYLSSSAVYPAILQGSRAAPPLAEADQPTGAFPEFIGRPDGWYGWVKLTGEMLCAELRAAGVGTTIVRPFSGYGTGQSVSMPFGAFIARARAKADPFRVWGSGRQVRDFVHVSDVVSATLALAAQEVTGPVNLCTGIGTSMDELAALVCAAAGYDPPLRHVPSAPTGVLRRVGDPTLLTDYYHPKVRLTEGIRMALDA